MRQNQVRGEWLFRLLLRLHPPPFRARYGEEMIAFFREAWHEQTQGRNALGVLAFWTRTVLGTIAAAVAQRVPAGRDGRGRDGDQGNAALWSSDLARDIRYALRSFARQPGFAAVTILTLALGIGSNAAVFSVLHSVLLAPLPYEEPERLVRMYWDEPGGVPSYLPDPAFLDFREHLTSVHLAALYNYSDTGADLVVDGQPERVRTLHVSAEYFEVLRAELVLGRAFVRDEEREDARVAVVSERLWRRALGGDPAAIGGALDLDGVRHHVLGVVSGSFKDPIEGEIDVWVPDRYNPAPWQWQNDQITVMGRLAPGVPLARAQTEVALRSRVQMAMEENPLEDARGVLVPLHDDLAGAAEPMLLVLMGAVALMLVLTCVNVASLVLARGAARSRELSIRTALGSGRSRLVRQLLVESLVLASAGGAAGLLTGAVVQQALVRLAPAALPDVAAIGYGWPVALFAGALALIVGLLIGAVPALQLTRRLETGVTTETRGGGERRGQQRLRSTLVVAQVSLALILLIGAGLLMVSLQRLRSVDLGVDAGNVWSFQVHLPTARYAEPAERVRFHDALHERLRAIPGVEAVGAASRLPATGDYHSPWGVRADRDDAPRVGAQNRVIQGEWFEALDIDLLEGRLFGPEDDADVPRRAVVSESLAHRAFPGEDAVGRRIRVLGASLEVIGVVEEVALTPWGEPAPTVYHAHAQFADNRNWPLFQVVEADPSVAPGLIERARAELAGLDPSLVLVEPRPLAEVLGRQSARERFASLLLASFAALAVGLAGLGIYGILAYAVSRSRHEIGVRMALGASAGDVRRMVVRRGLALTAAGVAAGALGALALTRLLESLLFEMSPTDPRVFATVAAAVLGIGVAASWLPARRATAVEPAEAFRAS